MGSCPQPNPTQNQTPKLHFLLYYLISGLFIHYCQHQVVKKLKGTEGVEDGERGKKKCALCVSLIANQQRA